MKYKIKDLITHKISGEWGNESTDGNGVKVIRTANFTNEGIINFDNVVIRQVEERKVEVKKLLPGDIIIEKSGGSPNQPVGRVVFFDVYSDELFLCNNFTTCLRPNTNIVHPRYLFLKLFELHKTGKTLRYQNKTTGIINLKLDNYLEEEIDIPVHMEDQIYIANILNKSEALITQRKESIRLLDELLKSTFLEMFGDPGTNPKSWHELRLVDVCKNPNDVKCGPFGTQLNKEEYLSGGVPLWGIPQINSEFKIQPKEFVSIQKAADLDQYSIIPGDIAMSRKGNVGKCSIYPVKYLKGIIHSDVLRIRVDNELVNPLFILFQLKISKRIEDQIASVSSGAVMAGINVGKLKNIYLLVPPLELQNQFVHIVGKVEDQKVLYQQSLQELGDLYGALSQKAFKGELTKTLNKHFAIGSF